MKYNKYVYLVFIYLSCFRLYSTEVISNWYCAVAIPFGKIMVRDVEESIITNQYIYKQYIWCSNEINAVYTAQHLSHTNVTCATQKLKEHGFVANVSVVYETYGNIEKINHVKELYVPPSSTNVVSSYRLPD